MKRIALCLVALTFAISTTACDSADPADANADAVSELVFDTSADDSERKYEAMVPVDYEIYSAVGDMPKVPADERPTPTVAIDVTARVAGVELSPQDLVLHFEGIEPQPTEQDEQKADPTFALFQVTDLCAFSQETCMGSFDLTVEYVGAEELTGRPGASS